MPKKYIKSLKYARIFKAARENANDAAEAIAKTPTRAHLLRFALPTILSVLIMSTFGIVDGIFVSRIIDPIALSAVSIVFPFIALVMAIGFMLGVGGNALIAKKLGAGFSVEAKQNFSLIVLVAFLVSVVIALLGLAFPNFILGVLGADDFVYPMALEYLRPMLYFMPPIMFGMVFQQFLITVGKAHYSAVTALVGGSASAGLNYLFIYLWGMGLTGAALASSIGYTLSAVVGLAYFTFSRQSSLRFVFPQLDIRALGRTCVNGASEMVTMLATSIIAVLMNNILMNISGAEAVAAAALMFAGVSIFGALFVGYSSGVMPIISYNYGKGDTDNLKMVYSNSLYLTGAISLASVVLAWLSVDFIIGIYDVAAGTAMHDMAFVGFRALAFSFILAGFNTFASMFFTALNNGAVSTALSFFRTLVFTVIALMALPRFFGLNGVWAAIPVAEALGMIITVFFFRKMRARYNY